MKTATRPRTTRDNLEKEYTSLLREYASGAGESALGRVYELGRRAISDQKSLVEIAAIHHQALQELLSKETNVRRRKHLLHAAADFFAECLSPYEMAQRGFQDAVKALRQLNETLEEEIKRVAYAVHDEAGQLLVAVHLALAELSRELPKLQQGQIAHIEELLNEVEKQLRRYSHELRPTILDDLGWIPAIRFLAEAASKRAALFVHIDAAFSERLPMPTETALYRIAQEAIQNTHKHARAKNIWIRAWREQQTLFFSIRDDGAGFDAHNLTAENGAKGLGLIAMQERASAIGATLLVESAFGRGTEISIRLPLEGTHANSRDPRG
jgi:signal transduction histidine kinase